MDTRVTYLALQLLAERYARHGAESAPEADGRSAGLTGSELRVFSQNGEDGIIEEILRRIGPGSGTFVEFGIEGGVEGNCVFLADVMGWRGLFIESAPEMYARLEAKYADIPEVRTLNETVTPENVDGLISSAGLPAEPDVLSIDVDGIDYWIWRASSLRPRIVVIEYNAHLAAGSHLVQPREPVLAWDGTDYFGAGLGALRDLGARKGYRLVHTDLAGVNAFFVREDVAAWFTGPVPTRSANFFLTGHGHPPHTGGRGYTDIATGDPSQSKEAH